MGKKLFFILLLSFSIFLFLQPFTYTSPYKTVFHVTEKSNVIVRGTKGSALTVNISFGDNEVKEWIDSLEQPYPFLFIDVDWAERFPETVQLIQQKKIPNGLLGQKGQLYEEDGELFLTHLKKYKAIFNESPLWFRTVDESFPPYLLSLLREAQINPLSSTVTWKGGKIPPVTEGEILSIPHHLDARIYLPELKKLDEQRNFSTLDEVLFGSIGNFKKIPQ